jgi:hypothetical protein
MEHGLGDLGHDLAGRRRNADVLGTCRRSAKELTLEPHQETPPSHLLPRFRLKSLVIKTVVPATKSNK